MNTSLIKRILYATDMSDDAIFACHYAMRMSQDCNAHLTIIYVTPDEIEEMSANMSYDLNSHYDEKYLDSFNKDNLSRSQETLIQKINDQCNKINPQLSGCTAKPQITIRIGDPVEQILLEAETDGYDLIVIGNRGHSLFDNILIGSVAGEVVKKSGLPVITVPLSKLLLSDARYEELPNILTAT
jgi:nucleotide-binding universal stress UspA family protein